MASGAGVDVGDTRARPSDPHDSGQDGGDGHWLGGRADEIDAVEISVGLSNIIPLFTPRAVTPRNRSRQHPKRGCAAARIRAPLGLAQQLS